MNQPEEPRKEPNDEGVDPPRLQLLLLVLFPFLLVAALGLLFGWFR